MDKKTNEKKDNGTDPFQHGLPLSLSCFHLLIEYFPVKCLCSSDFCSFSSSALFLLILNICSFLCYFVYLELHTHSPGAMIVHFSEALPKALPLRRLPSLSKQFWLSQVSLIPPSPTHCVSSIYCLISPSKNTLQCMGWFSFYTGGNRRPEHPMTSPRVPCWEVVHDG